MNETPPRFEDEYSKEAEALMQYYADQQRKEKFRHVGRNDKCPCGSNLKYKKCCLKATV